MVLRQAFCVAQQEKPIICCLFLLEGLPALAQNEALKCRPSGSVQVSHLEKMFLDT
jgi:hypothetical protein